MKSTNNILFNQVADELTKHTGTGAGRVQGTRDEKNEAKKEDQPEKKEEAPEKPKRPAIALMSAQALKMFLATGSTQAKELKAALAGHTVACRRLGPGDPALPQLDQDEVTADTLMIGFNMPINLALKGRKGIEIPLGKSCAKADAGSKIPLADTPFAANLVKAMNEIGNIPLRAYAVQRVPVIDPVEKAEETEEKKAAKNANELVF